MFQAGGIKINNNFEEIYAIHGFGAYADGLVTVPTQVITTAEQKLSIDGDGATSESGFLPREIRGTSELWDAVADKITPIAVGDTYSFRISFAITAKSGSPNSLTIKLDMGVYVTPTIVITEIEIQLSKTPPYSITQTFGGFSLATFVANGGQLFLTTDTGTVTIGDRRLFINRISSGQA